jgi:hypothetical protein
MRIFAAVMACLLAGGLWAADKPCVWGGRIETQAGGGVFFSGKGNGWGTNHRAIGQAVWSPIRRDDFWLPAYFGIDATADYATFHRKGHGEELFHWSFSATAGFGVHLPRHVWQPWITWGNFEAHANLIFGMSQVTESRTHRADFGIRAGGELVVSQFSLPSYENMWARLGLRAGAAAEIFFGTAQDANSLLDGWFQLSIYPWRFVFGIVISYRFIATDGISNNFFSFGICTQF